MFDFFPSDISLCRLDLDLQFRLDPGVKQKRLAGLIPKCGVYQIKVSQVQRVYKRIGKDCARRTSDSAAPWRQTDRLRLTGHDLYRPKTSSQVEKATTQKEKRQ